ncbi:conserved exported hypothetical protein [Candidatus Methylobacter favarea]|uniref:Porin family protein n=1 Tax=Candidatus Methylobacter favarea TaxID=2707345 RepID=A0A8S0Y6R5_9GAMM|nr:porin family protein [Candidatus Methylobacter favarea]CAA9891979.1 conserved exported hypothetical protein [Candidatus Methylobacter favarea]
MIKKTKLALGIATATFTMAAVLASPEAAALSRAERAAEAANNKVDALEAQLQSMQAELANLRAEASRPRMDADSEKVQELDQWMASVKAEPAKTKEHHDNTLFFRGGYSHQNNDRGGTLDPTEVPGVGSSRDGVAVGPISDKDGYYFGAGFDFGLTDDVWGMMDNTQVLGELMFDYVELGTHKNNGLSPAETSVLASLGANLPAANTQQATVNMLRLAASPKIKFMAESDFRPWIVPVGFELSVISPPSDAITVLAPGMQFGLGADYRIWKDMFIGADARYHYAPGDVDGININGLTAGGYLGIGF